MYKLCLFRNSKVTSQDKDDNGNPLMQFSDGKIEVRNFDQAASVLQAAKEKRLNETRLCLEGKGISVLLH